ncbi:MAG: cobaltochelatase subunit CobN, partial [Dolichospermum sp.]
EPVKEGTGRIVRYDLKPLAEVGHPRIDVLANLSGIFRDSFVNIIELLDDLFQRAAEIDEPEDMNFIRKHALVLKSQGVENYSARLFSNPAGDFGSLVNDRVVDGNWESGEDLGNTWESRNVFSYGRNDKGQA